MRVSAREENEKTGGDIYHIRMQDCLWEGGGRRRGEDERWEIEGAIDNSFLAYTFMTLVVCVCVLTCLIPLAAG